MMEERVLSLRLQQVADFVAPCHTVADVGCDHGYVSIYLLQRGIAKHAIAMDVRKGPLARAEQNRNLAGLQTCMECRLSDGLKDLKPNEAEVIVIAGMGGPLMTEILSRGRETKVLAKQLVLQPQSDIPAVRRYLHDIGYYIVREAFLQEEGKYYTVLQTEKRNARPETEDEAKAAEDAKELWKDVEYQYGRYLLEHKHPELFRYLEHENRQLHLLYGMLADQKAKNPTPKIECRMLEVAQKLRMNQEAQNYYTDQGGESDVC